MPGRLARTFIASASLLAAGCSPNLRDEPFACESSGLCPEGYSCRVGICVQDGAKPGVVHSARATWINPAEMFWFESSQGGAALLFNDNFTQGLKGIYEVRVAPDGTVADRRMLLPQGDGPAVASSIVTLPDGRYGIVTLRFPNIDGDTMMLELFAIERDLVSGTTAAVEKLFSASTLYLGGVEPPYVGAVVDGTTMYIAWTVPSGGGKTEVLRIEREGSLWKPTAKVDALLPSNIPPLSGDCQLFRLDDKSLTVRAGFENYAIATVNAAGVMSPFVSTTDEPLFFWTNGQFALRRGTYDESSETYDASYVFFDEKGKVVAEDKGFVLPAITSPFIGVAFGEGVLVAPVSRDPASPTIDVVWRSPTEPLRTVASVTRQSTEPVYSARAFVRDAKAYVAWTEFHEANMDLWVGVTDFKQSGAKSLVHKSSLARPVFSLPRRHP